MKQKIDKITKKLAIGDEFDELLTNGKPRGPNWLMRRCGKPSKGSTSNAPTDSYVKDLTAKFKEGLAAEVEEKVKQVQADVDEQVNMKVQENMAHVLKKLAEDNPNITVGIDELCAVVTSDFDEGTP